MLFTKWCLQEKVTVLLRSPLHAAVLNWPWRRTEHLDHLDPYPAHFPLVRSCRKPHQHRPPRVCPGGQGRALWLQDENKLEDAQCCLLSTNLFPRARGRQRQKDTELLRQAIPLPLLPDASSGREGSRALWWQNRGETSLKPSQISSPTAPRQDLYALTPPKTSGL